MFAYIGKIQKKIMSDFPWEEGRGGHTIVITGEEVRFFSILYYTVVLF